MDDEIAIKALRYDAIVNELYRKGMNTGIGFYGQIEFIKNLRIKEAVTVDDLVGVLKDLNDLSGMIAQYEARLNRQDKSPVYNWARRCQELVESVAYTQLGKSLTKDEIV